MAKKKPAKSRLEQLKQLERDIAKNPSLLHDLVVQPQKVTSKLDYLDDGLKASLGRVSILEVLSGLTGVLENIGVAQNCGPSSCGSGGTCEHTCTVANSCTDTCRTVTCQTAATIAQPAMAVATTALLETLILYSSQLAGLDQQVFRSVSRIR